MGLASLLCCRALLLVTFALLLSTAVWEAEGKKVKGPPKVATCLGAGRIVIGTERLGTQWRGWGTSLSWWANWAGGLQDTKLNKLLTYFFDKRRGLGLTMVRYNIGGGGQSKTGHQLDDAPLKYRKIPGFKYNATTPYDWHSDVNQRRVLLGAKRLGVKTFEAFSNSPPAWMTISKDYTGSAKAFEDNLAPANYGLFAAYLAEVVRVYKKKWGVTFNTVEPFNEAFEGHWVAGGDQEGCNFKSESISNFIPYLARALKKAGVTTRIASPDSVAANTPQLLKEISDESLALLAQINVHGYEPHAFQQSLPLQIKYREKIVIRASRLGREVAVSESGPFGFAGTEIDVALSLVRQIFLNINVMKASSWSYWQAIEDFQGSPYWGLIYAPFTPKTSRFIYKVRLQYYALLHLTRWVLPGTFPLVLESSCHYGLLAVHDATHNRLVVVVANYLTSYQRLQFKIMWRTNRGTRSTVMVYRTSSGEKHKLVDKYMATLPDQIGIRLAPYSLTTMVVYNVRA
eukprot:TRINITY_DN6817_c0_g3_i1.p1 TRINITY_DN6817_c0_g3~~TRINITY_DN6817_c0_g3_i1.p1  ORF type:complete len:524 (+),score=36.17 TRINITY_DN6817_c0_g3_i1:30-1574(+)